MADKSNDPVAMWQNMIGEMEKGFNSLANQAMTSPEFSKVMNQVGGATAGAGTAWILTEISGESDARWVSVGCDSG